MSTPADKSDAAGALSQSAISRRGIATWLSTAGSAVALVVSGISLWETTLKLPNLKVYVGDTISYTRDPWGSYEVLVIPITVTNSGARETALMSMRLAVKNAASGVTETFESSYFADATWFSGNDNVANRTKRPKAPFAPMSIAGRSAWTGTLLFYPPEYKEKRVVDPGSRLTAELTALIPPPEGWLERAFIRLPDPIPLTMQLPQFNVGVLVGGDTARVRLIKADAPATAAK